MDPETKQFVSSRKVVFDETTSYFPASGRSKVAPLEPFSSDVESSERGSTNSQNEIALVVQNETIVRRSTRESRQPSYLDDYEVQLNYSIVTSCFFIGSICDDEPKFYRDAQGVVEWETAMNEEIEALHKNGTWDLVPKPKDVEIITCKWVYKLKKKADGSIHRYKARLVAWGFSQQYGLDYEETFSPVAKMVTIRSVMSLAGCKTWSVWQLDVKNAFLYGELDHEIYME